MFLFFGLFVHGCVEYWQEYSQTDGYFLSDNMVVGGDFLAFYTGGKLWNLDRVRLYDISYQYLKQQELFGQMAERIGPCPFIYPP